jgi:hypothetical protein
MKLRMRFVAGAAFVALALGIATPGFWMGLPAAQAQNLGQRVVNGVVLDASSNAVSGATVFLKNTKTKTIRSYTSTEGGKFRFAQVNMSDDYDLWAEKDGKKSASKTISSWDTRKDVESELKFK